ncbi:heat-shock protein Hsp20 [Burkholderia multivorans]|uniref:heat-shock protein Hsp20 n=1 Tax=Burkholderia multivorans TaxID=87883 RepID=UPI0021BEF98E|nr:heat-shock protein Hsp20 [Burkholderia multivorans]
MSDSFFDVNLRGDLRRLQRQIAHFFAGLPARLRATRIGRFFDARQAATSDDTAPQRRDDPVHRT